jgi:hypothetical protein
MPMGKGRRPAAPATTRRYVDARQGRIEAPQIAKTIANRPRLGVPQQGGQGMEDPIAFWNRTLAEQAGLQFYGSDGDGDDSGGFDGGGGSRRYSGGGGGGGGGGGRGGPDWAAILAAINQPYDMAQQQVTNQAQGGRVRVGQENAALNKGITASNAQTNAAIQQRAALLKQIMSQAQGTMANFNAIGQRDLQGQGIAGTGLDAVAGIEAGRMQSLGQAQQTLGGDLDTLLRDQMAQRSAYSAQSQRDALLAISDAEQRAAQQIALQRAQEQAKVRAEAAAAGVRL